MSDARLTQDEAAALGRRLDAFAAGLDARELALLLTVLRDAEAAQLGDVDHRTPGDIVVAIHRAHRTPHISLNPQPVPIETSGDAATAVKDLVRRVSAAR